MFLLPEGSDIPMMIEIVVIADLTKPLSRGNRKKLDRHTPVREFGDCREVGRQDVVNLLVEQSVRFLPGKFWHGRNRIQLIDDRECHAGGGRDVPLFLCRRC